MGNGFKFGHMTRWWVYALLVIVLPLGAWHTHGLDVQGNGPHAYCVACSLHKVSDDHSHRPDTSAVPFFAETVCRAVTFFSPSVEHFSTIQRRAPPRS